MEFIIADLSPLELAGCDLDHFEAFLVGGTWSFRFVGGLPTRQENYLIQLEGEVCLPGNFQMPQMKGIKGSSKECQAWRMGHGIKGLLWSGGPDDLDFTHQVVLFGLELVHLHEL